MPLLCSRCRNGSGKSLCSCLLRPGKEGNGAAASRAGEPHMQGREGLRHAGSKDCRHTLVENFEKAG